MIHKHWTILAYEELDKTLNQYKEVTEIYILNALTEAEALRRAKIIIKKPLYTIRSVKECDSCGTKSATDEMVRKQTKLLDRELGEYE